MTENISRTDLFNAIAGMIFATAYESFPHYAQFEIEEVERALDAKPIYVETWQGEDIIDHWQFSNGDRVDALVKRTTEWLVEENYLSLFSNGIKTGFRLTEKGLVAMNMVPDSLSGNDNVGVRLKRAAGETAITARTAAVGEIIGVVFAGALKGFSGS